MIILDEAQLADPMMRHARLIWPHAPVLCLLGTWKESTNTDIARCFELELPVVIATTLQIPDHVEIGDVPRARFSIEEVEMTRLEYAAYNSALHLEFFSGSMQKVLIFPPGGSVLDYDRGLWKSIITRLREANQKLVAEIRRLLGCCPNARTLAEELCSKLGDTTAQEISNGVLEAAGSTIGVAECRERMKKLWDARDAILGGYSYVSTQLMHLTHVEHVECPVCLEDAAVFVMGSCGHAMCTACLTGMTTARCPICRCVNPCWYAAGDLRAALNGPAAPAKKKTSSKLERVVALLRGQVRRTLLVCPWTTLKDVHRELEMQGIQIGMLEGAAKQQERTLCRWERGELSALLCSPCVLGVDLPSARRVIFMTTLVRPNNFKQAVARVIRQGNSATVNDEEIEVIMLAAKDTIETKNREEHTRFHEIIRQMSNKGAPDDA